MGSLRFPYADVLGPDEIQVVASAFEATIESLDPVTDDSRRDAVARYIIGRALQRERDPIRLRDGALAHLHAPETSKSV